MKLEDPDFLSRVNKDLEDYQGLKLHYSKDQDLIVLNKLLATLIAYICYLKNAYDDYIRIKEELFKVSKELTAKTDELNIYRSWYLEDERRKNND